MNARVNCLWWQTEQLINAYILNSFKCWRMSRTFENSIIVIIQGLLLHWIEAYRKWLNVRKWFLCIPIWFLRNRCFDYSLIYFHFLQFLIKCKFLAVNKHSNRWIFSAWWMGNWKRCAQHTTRIHTSINMNVMTVRACIRMGLFVVCVRAYCVHGFGIAVRVLYVLCIYDMHESTSM